jgi:hypothetical protein
MTSTVEKFFRVQKAYIKLAAWSVTASAVPFFAASASLAPPWPPALAGITAIAQLVVLVLAFQFLGSATKGAVDRVLIAGSIALVTTVLVYLILFRVLTVVVYSRGRMATGAGASSERFCVQRYRTQSVSKQMPVTRH